MELSDLNPIRSVLPNGLRLLAVPMPHVHRSVIEAQIRIGSRFESAEDNGISHFLEHMLYRGTPRFPTAHDQALAFESLGGTLLAATAKDFGSLQIALPPERFRDALPLLSEVYQEPLLGGIEIERGIVQEEILETLDEAGNLIDADDLLGSVAFPGHPLGRPITGSPAHVERFDPAALRRHHEHFYVGTGTTLVVAGAFDADAVLRELEQLFGGLAAGKRASVSPPASQSSPAFRFVPHAASQTCLRVGFRAPSFLDAREPATQLLVRVLDDGLSTRLYEHICDRKGLCYDVAACYEAYEDVGLVDLSAESANERAAEVLGELFAVVNRLREEGPSPEELDKAKRRHRWQLQMMLDDPEEVASHFAMSELAGTGLHPAARRDQLARVTRDQVMAAAVELFQPANLSVVAVGAHARRGRDRLRQLTLEYG
ncbi:MAG TPA: pitrilysin family protein [Polyangiaceae bacterium]|nr:pitrilysin family protein [Polyangiaceae bacterium]